MRKCSVFLIALPAAACAVAALAAAGNSVYYHGKALTHAARQIEGRTYVPLSDVARILGGRVASRDGGGQEIVTDGSGSSDAGSNSAASAGGANEVRGTDGRVGDWFFNGYQRFRVNSVDHPDTYTWQYSDASGADKPAGPNDELVVFHCTIKNGRKVSDQPILAVHGTSVQNTALTDDEGQSYAPIDFDVRGGSLLPGAAKNFAVIFSVPRGTKLKDLVFTLYSYGHSEGSDVRVHLSDL